MVVYGSGTVIARMAHAHLGHGGPFEDCRRCHAFQWLPGPDGDFGILIHDGQGKLIETSALIGRLMVP